MRTGRSWSSLGVGILLMMFGAAGPLQAQTEPDGTTADEEISGPAAVQPGQPSDIGEAGSSAAEKLRAHDAVWLVGVRSPTLDGVRVSRGSQVAPPPDASDVEFGVYIIGVGLGLLLILLLD